MSGHARIVRGLLATVVVLSVAIALGLSVVSPATADITADPTTVDFGSVVVGTTVTRPISITVDDGYYLSSSAGGGLSAPWALSSGTCAPDGKGLVGPATCTLQESFTPNQVGAVSTTVTLGECLLADSSGCTSVVVPLTGTGAPSLAANPATLDFHAITLDRTVSRLITITIDPGYRYSPLGQTGADQDPWTFDAGECDHNGTAATGPIKCTVRESFRPTTVGPVSDTLAISECNSSGDCQSVDIPVSGAGKLDLAADPASVDFGSVPVNTTVSQTVTITVDDGFKVDASSSTGQGAPFGFSYDTCGADGGFTGPGTCTVKETFMPESTTPATGTVAVSECPTSGGSCQSVRAPVTGNGIAPEATLSDPALTFPRQGIGTTSGPQTFSITNTGAEPLHVGAMSTTGDFALVSNQCANQSVAVGDSCSVGVTFTPTAGADRPGSVTIHSDAINGTQHVSLDGAGAIPTVLVTPSGLTFNGRPVGTTSPARTITLVNTSDVALLFRGESVTGDFAVAPTGTCAVGAEVAAGDACTVNVTFTPTDVDTRDGALILKTTATGSPHVVALSGAGIAATPGFSVSPGSLPFGSQVVGSTSTTRSVVVTNHGNAPLRLSQIGTTGDFARTGGTCGTTAGLAPGASCSVAVKFAPTRAGSRTGALSFTDNASSSPQHVALSGTGTAPVASLSTTSLSFGTVRVGSTSAPRTVRLTNTGNAPLSVEGGTIAGDFALSSSSTCRAGTRLAPSASCLIAISFAPRALGSRTGSLSIRDNASTSPQRVSLSGTGGH